MVLDLKDIDEVIEKTSEQIIEEFKLEVLSRLRSTALLIKLTQDFVHTGILANPNGIQKEVIQIQFGESFMIALGEVDDAANSLLKKVNI